MTPQRPKSVAEAARVCREERVPLWVPLREFYDTVYGSPFIGREHFFEDEPEVIGDARYDACVAAAAEYFALRYGFPIPKWTLDRERRFLKEPWFPGGFESLKAICVAESPLPFRRRLIFMGKEPCYRLSRDRLEPEYTLAFEGNAGERKEKRAAVDRNDVVSGLARLGELARERDMRLEIALYGGAAIMLAIDEGRMAKDVDAVFLDAPSIARHLAAIVAEENGWPGDWLNDGVKGFVSRNQEFDAMEIGPGISVHVATPEYLFAMKALSMRPDRESSDRNDLVLLAERCSIQTLAEALATVEKFYLLAPKGPCLQAGDARRYFS